MTKDIIITHQESIKVECAKTLVGKSILIDRNLLAINKNITPNVTKMEIVEFRKCPESNKGYFVLLDVQDHHKYHNVNLEQFSIALSKCVVLD